MQNNSRNSSEASTEGVQEKEIGGFNREALKGGRDDAIEDTVAKMMDFKRKLQNCHSGWHRFRKHHHPLGQS
jgi:hypothetical protein